MKRTSLILLAAGTLLLAIVSAAWWTSTPRGARTVGEAIVLIAGAASAFGAVRRVPSATPTVLYTTVIGGVLVIARPGGRLFPIMLSVFVALLWFSLVFVQKMTANQGRP